MSSKPFRLSVKAIILDKNGRCLVLKRSFNSGSNAGLWDLPGGKVDPGETFDAALRREVAEETGLTISINRVVWTTQSETPAARIIYLILEASLESGQVMLSPEHDAFAWVEPRDLPTLELVKQFRSLAWAYRRQGVGADG